MLIYTSGCFFAHIIRSQTNKYALSLVYIDLVLVRESGSHVSPVIQQEADVPDGSAQVIMVTADFHRRGGRMDECRRDVSSVSS